MKCLEGTDEGNIDREKENVQRERNVIWNETE
jgi:hypothetical protein